MQPSKGKVNILNVGAGDLELSFDPNNPAERIRAARIVKDLGVRLHSNEQPISSLSGGNQQKAVFGRWLATEPKLLLLDEPTRGVDVGAKAEIYSLIDTAAQDGLAVLVASSELEELLWICHRIVVMANSYHGDTIGAMSIGERGVYNRAYQPLLFDVDRLPFPEGDGAGAIDALDRLCRAGPPAALIVEPLILGAGGMLIYPAHVLKALREVCARHGVLFIADEVMTGWGRTGTLLACEQAGVVPDILCLSKGLTGGAVPLAVTLAREAIFEAHLSQDRARMFFHSSSYTANPLACAAAAANLAIWEEEPVLEGVALLAGRQAERLARIAGNPVVENPRQLGTIAAFEVRAPVSGYLSGIGPRLMAFCRERDVLLRPLGNTVYVMPPYCIDEADLDAVYAAVEDAIS